MTVRAASAYQACHELFGSHPLAVRDVNLSGTVRSMVFLVEDDHLPRFFVLSQGCGYDLPVYSLCPWPAGDVVDVSADDDLPEPLASAVARDLSGPSGLTLRRGRYIGSQALRSGRPVPSLTALLADNGKIDMAGRFRRPVLRGGWPSAGR